MLRAAVILVTLLEPAASHEGHRCPLDGGIPPEVPNHSPQQYIISEHEPGTEEHRRELHSTWQGDAAFSPIRIQLRFDDMTELTSSEQNFLQNTLMPAAAAWAEGALAVRPVASNLLVERYCPSTWGGTGVCYSTASPETCGATGDTSAVTVPDELLAETRVCTACYGSTCEDPGSTCSTLSAGAGTAHDFVLFVSAVTSNICGGGTIAYAVTCKRDQYDRPIMGHANFCPNLLSEAEADYPKQLSTAIHELVHALGFASGSWSLFRFDDGITPRTPREADGWPALTSSFSCPTGLVSEQFVPNSNTLVTSTERGVSVTRIVTPRVASIAQDMFGCSTLPGAELENQPTGANACWGSHWEQRMHKNDLMGAVSSTSAVRSPLILALLEDTGWYRANYSYAEPQRWGRASDGTPIGCSFSTSKCLISETPIDPAHFCDDGAAVGCTLDTTHRGYCNKGTYGSALPAEMQYFSVTTHGGAQQTTDYCPYFEGYNDGGCGISANAPEGTSSSNYNYKAESYGADSVCAMSTLTQTISSYRLGSNPSVPSCHKHRCNGNTVQLELILADGQSSWQDCPSAGGTIAAPAGAPGTLDGSLICPPATALLCATPACPTKCADSPYCIAGVCICGDAWNTTLDWASCAAAGPSAPPSPFAPPADPPSPSTPPAVPPSPASPPSPAVPPFPPLADGVVVVTIQATVVTLGFTLGGTVESFGQAAQDDFVTVVRAELSCYEPDCRVELRVSSASVAVDAVVTIPNTGGGDANAISSAATTFAGNSIADLSATLGVAVEANTAATVQSNVVTPYAAAPPPPNPPPPDAPAASPPPPPQSMVPMIAGAGGGAVGVLLLVIAWRIRANRIHREKTRAMKTTRALAAAKGPETTQSV